MKKKLFGLILNLFLFITLSLPQFSAVKAQSCKASDIPSYGKWTYDVDGNGKVEDYFCGNAGDVINYDCDNCVVPFTITSSSGQIITDGYGDVTLPATGRYKVTIGYAFGQRAEKDLNSCHDDPSYDQCGQDESGGGCVNYGPQICDTSYVPNSGRVALYLTLKSSGLSSSSNNSTGSNPALSATKVPKAVATPVPSNSLKTSTSNSSDLTNAALIIAGIIVTVFIITKAFQRPAPISTYQAAASSQSLGTRLGNLDAPRSSLIPPKPIEPQPRASITTMSNDVAVAPEPKPSVVAPTPINPVKVEPPVTNPWLKKPDARPKMPSIDQSSSNSPSENNDTDTPKPNPWLKK